MRAVLRCLPIIAVCAVMLGYMALPSPEERVTMLLRDGKIAEARNDLEKLYLAGDRRPHILLQLANLEDRVGQTTHSIELFEAYVTARPKSVEPARRLADMLIEDGQLEKGLAALRRSVERTSSAADFDRLVALLRLHGLYDEERALLGSYIDSPIISSANLARLGALAANRKEFSVARRALTLADEREVASVQAPRKLLFDILLDLGLFDEARVKALTWSVQWRDTDAATDFVTALARAGQDDSAVELSEGVSRTLPDFQLVAVDELSRKGLLRPAQYVLRSWFARTKSPQPDQLARYIALCSQVRDMGAPFGELIVLTRTSGSEAASADLADSLAAAYGWQALIPIQRFLTREILNMRPLFAADLAANRNNQTLARMYLERVDPATLRPRDLARWLKLAEGVDPDWSYSALLRSWRAQSLPADLKSELANMAAARQDWGVHAALLRSPRSARKVVLDIGQPQYR